MIDHILDPVVKVNPEEVIFVIGFRGEEIQEYVEANFSFKSTFVRQDRLLGLGYAVLLPVHEAGLVAALEPPAHSHAATAEAYGLHTVELAVMNGHRVLGSEPYALEMRCVAGVACAK